MSSPLSGGNTGFPQCSDLSQRSSGRANERDRKLRRFMVDALQALQRQRFLDFSDAVRTAKRNSSRKALRSAHDDNIPKGNDSNEHIDQQETMVIEFRFTQIRNRQDYVQLIDGLEKVCRDHGQNVPSFTAWFLFVSLCYWTDIR